MLPQKPPGRNPPFRFLPIPAGSIRYFTGIYRRPNGAPSASRILKRLSSPGVCPAAGQVISGSRQSGPLPAALQRCSKLSGIGVDPGQNRLRVSPGADETGPVRLPRRPSLHPPRCQPSVTTGSRCPSRERSSLVIVPACSATSSARMACLPSAPMRVTVSPGLTAGRSVTSASS